ncbi:hypothetical protein [Flavobacterium undicola]|uniref:hypothetical protein n=1 Tax=Flavobacterium undicola TaxID=1932779 RepID=UPI0013789C3E|nr:hypothetical protein [Flavobacterium undicola]MBA0884916.1 hypothetical protein [Flavobacterium undicola]
MSLKKIVVAGGIFMLGYFLLKDKAKKLTAQFGLVKILPVGFKNLNGKWNNGKPSVSFNLDLNFINPTPQNFKADGVVIVLKKILFYDKNNVFLGQSDINMSSLSIPANSSTVVRNVPVLLDLQTTLINAITIINNGSFVPANIKIEAIISVLGIEYKLKQ